MRNELNERSSKIFNVMNVMTGGDYPKARGGIRLRNTSRGVWVSRKEVWKSKDMLFLRLLDPTSIRDA